MARIRAGNFYCWKQAVELAGRVPEVQVASDMDSKGCGVCGDPAAADSVAHFLFDCPLPALKEIRERLGMLKHATMLCERVSDFKRVHDSCNGYKKGQVLTEQQCKLTTESMANMLLGGNMYRTDDMTSPSSLPFGFINLEQWCCTNDKGTGPKLQPPSRQKVIADACVQMRGEEDKADVQYGGKFQFNNWFLETGFMLTARFLQESMTIRNNAIWKNDTCSKLGQSQQPLVRQPSGLTPMGGTVALTGAAG